MLHIPQGQILFLNGLHAAQSFYEKRIQPLFYLKESCFLVSLRMNVTRFEEGKTKF